MYTHKQSAIWQILVFTEVLFSPLPLGEWLMCGVRGGVTQLQCAGLSSLRFIVSEISLSHSPQNPKGARAETMSVITACTVFIWEAEMTSECCHMRVWLVRCLSVTSPCKTHACSYVKVCSVGFEACFLFYSFELFNLNWVLFKLFVYIFFFFFWSLFIMFLFSSINMVITVII